MAGLPRAASKRAYSWWWDSHIGPKNSKWLQENLTDMDAKVKSMIKLIEEDGDSFARRAEMYYKKRPELMKLVEEFYRAYRALAERYDNATGVLRQAQRTMIEAFPNHDPMENSDDSPESTVSEVGPHTPAVQSPLRALFGSDYLQKGTKHLGEGRVRKSLNFHNTEALSESEVVNNFEKEIQFLKDALAKLEAEKVAGKTLHDQSLEQLKKLESEVSRAQQDSREFNDRANKAEREVQALGVFLTKLEAEKEASLLKYEKCLEMIANLEIDASQAKEKVEELNKRAFKAESEKDEALERYKHSLDLISNLENKLKLAEEDAKHLRERADNAEKEVESLKQTLAKLTEENEYNILQYQQCLEKISITEQNLSCAQEEVQKLKGELDIGATKLKGAEEQCLALEKSNESLNSEMGSLVLKMGSQSEELTEKQKELGKLWTCLQEERFRFVEAETAFQTLQQLHTQTQEQLRSLALELENKGQLLKDRETHNESLLDEIMKINKENKSLNDSNLSSSISIKEMQNEIFGLVESRGKLAEEVELRVDQRNALQQEIYCLKEDINELSRRNQTLLEQVDAVGLSPESFESSVKQLQTENSGLKETSEKEKAEKMLLLKELAIMEQLLEKNALLEKSLSDLTVELEGARRKINALEHSFETLLEEKSTILAEKAAVMSQLQVMIENLEKISEKNNCLENSLSDACNELDGLKERSKTLEESCQSLEKEKTYLIDEKDTLVFQGKTTQQTLESLERKQRELEERYSGLEREREFLFSKIEELSLSLDAEKKDHATFAQKTETQLAGMGKRISLLQEEDFSRRREFEEELDKAMDNQLEIFILRKCIEDLKEKNSSLLADCQKLVEASKLSDKLIFELKHDNLEKQVEVKSMSDQTTMFKIGMCEFSKALGIDLSHGPEDNLVGDQKYLSYMLSKIEDTNNFLHQILDENQKLDVEMSVIVTLLGQLRLDAKSLDIERETLDKELKIKNEQLSLSQNEVNKLLELNGDLNMKVSNLTSLVANLNKEIDETKAVSNNQENKINKLSDDNVIKTEENLCLCKENNELGNKLNKLHEEIGLTTHMWESEAGTMFEELQCSTVFQALLEEALYKLKDGVTSKDAQIELLEKRIGTLEGENGGHKAQLSAHAPLILSLKDSISSLETRTLRNKLQKSQSEGAKDNVLVSNKIWNVDQKVDVNSELKDLLYRIKVIEKAVVQKERLEAQEFVEANTKLEAAKKSIDDSKFRECSNREYSVPVSDNSELENESSMKDIILDVNSESSSRELSRQGERKSHRKMDRSWDSADLDRNIEFFIGRDKRVKSPPGEILRRQKSKYRNSEIVAEKELGVDKLAISRTFSQRSQEASKAKILERLNSDAEKLTNLQIAVQDLMKKTKITEKGKKGTSVYEYDTLRDQLEEAEEAIIELSEYNEKLMRSAEKRSFSSNIKSGVDSEESGSARRRRISEQARKLSEKIGRLQLEVQKIQFVLLKINDEKEKESKGKSRLTEMRRKVMLRDYLYGVRTPSHQPRRKKSAFCGCIQPRED